MVHITGNSTFINSQINEVVYGDAVLNVKISEQNLGGAIEEIKYLKNEFAFEDPKLDQIIESQDSEIDKKNVLRELVSYAVSLKALHDAGDLVAIYGTGAAEFCRRLFTIVFGG